MRFDQLVLPGSYVSGETAAGSLGSSSVCFFDYQVGLSAQRIYQEQVLKPLISTTSGRF
jgi:hypothetical protein